MLNKRGAIKVSVLIVGLSVILLWLTMPRGPSLNYRLLSIETELTRLYIQCAHYAEVNGEKLPKRLADVVSQESSPISVGDLQHVEVGEDGSFKLGERLDYHRGDGRLRREEKLVLISCDHLVDHKLYEISILHDGTTTAVLAEGKN